MANLQVVHLILFLILYTTNPVMLMFAGSVTSGKYTLQFFTTIYVYFLPWNQFKIALFQMTTLMGFFKLKMTFCQCGLAGYVIMGITLKCCTTSFRNKIAGSS